MNKTYGGWRNSLSKLLFKYNDRLPDGSKTSDVMRNTRHAILTQSFALLHDNGYVLETGHDFCGKHMAGLARLWQERGLPPVDLHNNTLVIRHFAGWIGKQDLIYPSVFYFGDCVAHFPEDSFITVNYAPLSDSPKLIVSDGKQVICPYCGDTAQLVDSIRVYRRSYGMIWLCRPCDAYVGTHKDSPNHVPLGRLANNELRVWKMRAHAEFDPIWHRIMEREQCSKSRARNTAYSWLAEQLGITVQDCHIGMFDVPMCRRVETLCREHLRITRLSERKPLEQTA